MVLMKAEHESIRCLKTKVEAVFNYRVCNTGTVGRIFNLADGRDIAVIRYGRNGVFLCPINQFSSRRKTKMSTAFRKSDGFVAQSRSVRRNENPPRVSRIRGRLPSCVDLGYDDDDEENTCPDCGYVNCECCSECGSPECEVCGECGLSSCTHCS